MVLLWRFCSNCVELHRCLHRKIENSFPTFTPISGGTVCCERGVSVLGLPEQRSHSNAHSSPGTGLEEKPGLRKSVHGSYQPKGPLGLKRSLYYIFLFQAKQCERFHILYLPWFLSLEIIPPQPPPSCPFW